MKARTPKLSKCSIKTSETSSDGAAEAFRALFDEAYALWQLRPHNKSLQSAALLFHRHVPRSVSAHPDILTMMDEKKKWSLFECLCKQAHGACHKTLKFLIQTNPQMLNWPCTLLYGEKSTLLHLIADNVWHCTLLPWIGERYPEAFQHEMSRRNPPHLAMMKFYANERIGVETVRKFYEKYPQGLGENDKVSPIVGYPLSITLKGTRVPDVDLFVWMAKQYPEAVHHRFNRGLTILHEACFSLAVIEDENELEYGPSDSTLDLSYICGFLVTEHPSLVREKWHDYGCYLPIHMLVEDCHRLTVRAVVYVLLKAYPECLQVEAGTLYPKLATVPFLQKIHPLVVEELEIDQQISVLAHVSEMMAKATNWSTHHPVTSLTASDKSAVKLPSLGSLSKVFCSWELVWGEKRVFDVLSARKLRIHERVARMYPGEDVLDDVEQEYDYVPEEIKEANS